MELDQVVLMEWLKTGMQARGMTQRQLAVQSGVDHSTISRILSGDRSAAWSTVLRLAVALGEPLPAPNDAGYHPSAVARVERALRSDASIDPSDRERLVRLYLEVRSKRRADDENGPAPPHGGAPGGIAQPRAVNGHLNGHLNGAAHATTGVTPAPADDVEPTGLQDTVEELLEIWCAAEQVVQTTGSTEPDHETALMMCAQVRTLHRALTDRAVPVTRDRLVSCQDTIRSARETLARVRGAHVSDWA